MAFYNEEYSNICKEWISNNQVFYNNKIDVAKRTIKVGGLLHMYQLAIENMPANPLLSKAGEYGNVVKKYHKSIHSTFGVKALMSQDNYLSLITMSNKDVVLFSTSWLIHGDFYENLVYQIIDSYNDSDFKKKELSLYDLKKRIISESIFLGIKSLEDWQKYDRDMKEIKGWTILPDDFEVPQPFGQTDKQEKHLISTNVNNPQKKEEGTNKTDTNTFFTMLLCKDSIKPKVIEALAVEITSINSQDRIANILLSLVRKEWVDSETRFLPFYNAFAMAIRPHTKKEFHLISRNKGSKVYYNNSALFLHESKGELNEEEEQRLNEIKRICNKLEKIESETEITNKTEVS